MGPQALGDFVENIPRMSVNTEVSPLRYAPVEMTKGRVVFPAAIGCW
jgi:hypothetical protein